MTAAPPVGAWTTGRVAEVDHTGDRLVRLRLEVADRVDHLPGQHYVVRLRAPDDYTAQRSYSIASEPADPLLELMVERLPDGEVSGHLHDEARAGDVLELRGPIGGWFTWSGEVTAVCVAGGSGVVPIVSMVRHARRHDLLDRLRVIAVARTWADLPYADELRSAGAFIALTRENLGDRVAHPPWLDEVQHLVDGAERGYVCGSVGFASYATRLLGEAGMLASSVRVEQFGASG
ncbi:FAD-binding oxidoreductase [Nocardioides sp. SYSU D00038]|uniref:FAD-binding oxidoreductase n=1 Tax=Nocardioides sp. SYSU D00038 TaxID=2812554 RepID=UPI0027DD0450|nr:FAD-binding oxidoreductase [Nocardioides sp. SYSU D00038]